MYSDLVMEHFRNPRNIGEIPNADGVGEVGNPVCGDIMKLYIKIGKKGEELARHVGAISKQRMLELFHSGGMAQ